nr:hypothetical protein [Maliibacterium massiliense]
MKRRAIACLLCALALLCAGCSAPQDTQEPDALSGDVFNLTRDAFLRALGEDLGREVPPPSEEFELEGERFYAYALGEALQLTLTCGGETGMVRMARLEVSDPAAMDDFGACMASVAHVLDPALDDVAASELAAQLDIDNTAEARQAYWPHADVLYTYRVAEGAISFSVLPADGQSAARED